MDIHSYNLNQKKLLIFDFDGTLVNTSPIHEKAFKLTLQNFDLNYRYSDLAGMSTKFAMKKILKLNNLELQKETIDELIKTKQRHASILIDSTLQPCQNLIQFLNHTYKIFKLCIVSSGSKDNVLRALKKLNYLKFFDPIICAEDLEKTKPYPDGFNLALKLTGMNAKEAIIFEDARPGFEAALAAKIDYVDINQTSWKQLLDLIS